MQRPGNINGLQGITPRHSKLGNYIGLGAFGKGMMMPPPGPPAGTPAATAAYIGGKWKCDGNPPAQTKNGYFHCCPGGWTKTPYEVTRPCGKDYGQIVCGPLPEGATTDDGVCCEDLREWMPHTSDGSDPCLSAALASGRAVPNVTETMLAPQLVLDQGPLISPVVMLAGGLAVAALFIVTIIIKLKS